MTNTEEVKSHSVKELIEKAKYVPSTRNHSKNGITSSMIGKLDKAGTSQYGNSTEYKCAPQRRTACIGLTYGVSKKTSRFQILFLNIIVAVQSLF